MDKSAVIQETAEHVKSLLTGEGSGHDWWHTQRVRQQALQIGKEENANLFVVELAALLHDVADWKFSGGDETAGSRAARSWLEKLELDEATILHVCEIVHNLSFKGAGVTAGMKTLEGMVVQDADRLDAMGAIGIARTFAYGGYRRREIHNPDIQPELHETFEEYKNSRGPTVNHFYEKLLLLKDRMNTTAGRSLAVERHLFMLEFLRRFYDEWEGRA